MVKNKNLHAARNKKNDEFYTQFLDIWKELNNYKDFFNGKVVYCNCNDTMESNFFKFFKINFKRFGLKKLITIGYKKDGHGVAFVYDGNKNRNSKVDDSEVKVIKLKGNGGYETEECIAFLKEADVVVTNPPFSLFRDYVKQLMDYNKKFLIIGNNNAITYKEIFQYIQNNELWLGFSVNKTMKFQLSDICEKFDEIDKNGKKYGKVSAITWFTNIPNNKRNQPLDLCCKYNPTDYPKYDNYNAINVDKVMDIPEDYDGVMGVPITFLGKYCDTQFEIVGWSRHNDLGMSGGYWQGGKKGATINGKQVYRRILIKRIK